jgi:hypothetical protein
MDSTNNTEQTAKPMQQAANERDARAANDPTGPQVDQLDKDALARVAAAREADRRDAAARLGVNVIEAVRMIDRKERDTEENDDAKGKHISRGDDEGEQEGNTRAKRGRVADLEKKYVVADDKFFFRGRENALAFEDKGKTLSTEHNDSDVARSMVDLAQAKGWSSIKLSGHDDFKREAWLQASMKGIEVTGYKPKDVDMARLDELKAAHTKENRVEQGRESARDKTASNEAGAKDPKDANRSLSVANQIAEVARKAAAQKGYSPKAQDAVATVARERVEGLARDGKKASMVKLDRDAQRSRQPAPAVPVKRVERGNMER